MTNTFSSYPLVSVVIPTYNHANFLKRSLRSVVNQTYLNLEIIIVDNHSTDDTDLVIKSFRDHRIRTFKIHNNGVIAASRNCGIAHSNGDWIAFLDSDDYWLPSKIELAISAITNNPCDVVTHDELLVSKSLNSSRVLRHGPLTSDLYKSMLIYGNRLSPSATIVRRDFLSSHDLLFNTSSSFITVEDFDFWLNLAFNNARFLFLPIVLGEYVIHDSNSSSKLDLHYRNLENLLIYHVYHIQQFSTNYQSLVSFIQLRLSLMRVKLILSKGSYARALFAFFKLFTSSPVHTLLFIFQYLKISLLLLFRTSNS